MYRPIGFSAQHEMELLEIDHERLKPNAARRYQCVWMRFALGMKAPRIAEVLNLNPSTVRHIQSAFMREGAKAILGRGNWGGRRHQYMTLEEECAFLHNLPFQRLPLISEPSSRILKRQSGGGWMPPPYADCSNAMAGAKPYRNTS